MKEQAIPMSAYELKRWEELNAHWAKKAERKQVMPARARAALEAGAENAKKASAKVGRAIAEVTPDKVRDIAEYAVDAALLPTVEAVVHLLELINEWVVELSDPKVVLRHHQASGREVNEIQDLKSLDLKDLDEFTRRMRLHWASVGVGEGAAFGAFAMIPVPVVGSAAAIGLDVIAMQALTGAIAARACYAYGLDANDPEMKHVIDRMVFRTYRDQAAKAGTVKNASKAFNASRGRINWSQKLRDDHRLMSAVEKLLKRVGDGSRVPVKNARMGMPVVSVLVGAGTNSYILGDTAHQACRYAATLFLAEKHGLPLPVNIQRDLTDLQQGENVDEPAG